MIAKIDNYGLLFNFKNEDGTTIIKIPAQKVKLLWTFVGNVQTQQNPPDKIKEIIVDSDILQIQIWTPQKINNYTIIDDKQKLLNIIKIDNSTNVFNEK